jgi:uncharacterized protein YbcC (UPF0753/DUF2309 family)
VSASAASASPRQLPEASRREQLVLAALGAATAKLPVAWPIADLIAVNPLAGLQELGFEAAVARGRELLGVRGHMTIAQFRASYAAGRVTRADLLSALRRRMPAGALGGTAEEDLLAALLEAPADDASPSPVLGVAGRLDAALGTGLAAAVDQEVLKWCSAFCGCAQAAWKMPGRERGLFCAWRAMAAGDPGLRRLAAPGAASLIPEQPLAAISWALELLAVPDARLERELTEQLFRAPGFAAHFRWREEHPELCETPGGTGDLLALRLSYEALAIARLARDRGLALQALLAEAEQQPALQPSHSQGEVAPLALGSRERAWIWLEAYEWHYRDRLLAKLARTDQPADAGRPMTADSTPAAQAIFCIDTRSEGIRRALESLSPGRWQTFGMAGFFGLPVVLEHLRSSQATRLLPGPLAPTVAASESERGAGAAVLARRGRAQALADAHRATKASPLAPYSMAEATGWLTGAAAVARTLLTRPRGGAVPARPPLELRTGLELGDQVEWARQTLETIGLTGPFAPVVLIAGHTSLVTNNAYRAALECGACGGHGGADNARLAAMVLNDQRVRAGLREHGLEVPASTRFVAAEHDTATDTVSLLDVEQTSGLEAVRADLAAAGAANAAERARLLPDRITPRRRARDWAQVRPEWGLARNAAFIVAPSAAVSGLDLGCRTFLHSYEWRNDPDGTALATILTAPGLVVQWISAQYYFSSVDPEILGAGDKTLHNVLGEAGVLLGSGGDLQLGLPWQSVAYGDELFHEPMRPLFVVQAPLERIDALIASSELLSQYVGGSWIALAAREQPEHPWQLRAPAGGWRIWRAAEAEVPDQAR